MIPSIIIHCFLPQSTAIHCNMRQYVYNISTIFIMSVTSKPTKLHQFPPQSTAICGNLRQYVYNMSTICLQHICNISAISVISATSAKPTKLHQFPPQRCQSRSPPLAEPMTIFYARHRKSLLARLPLAPWRPSRHISLYYP